MKKILLIIILILCSFLVSANSVCKDSACTAVDMIVADAGGDFTAPVYTMDGSNWLNHDSNLTYGSCITDNARFQPIAYDYNDDGAVEIIVVVSNTVIKIYNTNCYEEASITVNETINSAVQLSDYDYDEDLDLIVLTTKSIRIYEYETLDLLDSYEYLADTSGNAAVYQMGCDNQVCFTHVQNRVYIFNTAFGMTFIKNVNMSTLLPYSYGSSTAAPYWSGYAQAYGDTVYATYCQHSTSQSYITCTVIETDGTMHALTQTLASFNVNTIYKYNAGFVKMGSVYRFVISILFQKNSVYEMTLIAVYDSSFNVIKGETSFCASGCLAGTSHARSMASISDYNKDGDSELCYFENSTNNPTEANFVCYSNTFASPIINETYNITEIGSGFPFTFFMGDADKDEDYQNIITPKGIYNINPDTQNNIYNTSMAFNQWTDLNMIGFLDYDTFSASEVNFIGNMHYYFADSDEAFLMRVTDIVTTCGDGSCTGSESVFTCPADCIDFTLPFNPGDQCLIDSSCPDAFPYCVNNICVKIFDISNNESCQYNTDCPSTEPICLDNTCVSGISGGLGAVNLSHHNLTTVPTTLNADGTVDDVGGFFDILSSGNAKVKFLFGIFIVLGIGFYALKALPAGSGIPGMFIVGFVVILAIVLAMVLGLLPSYVLILLLIGIIGLWLLLSKAGSPAGG